MPGPYTNGNGTYGKSLSPDFRDQQSQPRPNEFDRRRGRQPSYNSGRSESRGRGAQAERQVDDVLDYMKQDWRFMIGDDCLPAYTAMQFLDDSSLGLGHRYDEFYRAHQQLQSALRGIVNEHYQGFNSSIGTYHQLTLGIQSSQNRIRELRQALIDSKGYLTSTKAEFSTVFNSSRDYSSQLETISALEQIQGVPETLESRMSEKRFISAVESLQEGVLLIQGPQLEKVAALGEMKIYMSNQEHALADILVEELHNHLYLKSPYCESRWAEYGKLYASNEEVNEAHSRVRELYEFLDQLDTAVPLLDDSSRNPEANSFQYIRTLVESLHRLGRLEDVLEIMEERLPVELYRVLERSSSEVQQRHPSTAQIQLSNIITKLSLAMDDPSRDKIIKDLLGTLYARFEAIAESYRALHEIIEGICKRETVYDVARMTRGFKELWKLYQSEIRSLLHDYLSSDGSSDRLDGLTSEENVFRQQRERNKKCTFKMEWLDPKDPDLKTERDDIKALWQKQIPGLTSLASANKHSNSISAAGNGEGSSAGHKTLVKPSVFNITCLLPPSVMFLRRLKDVVPPTSNIVIGTLSSFLNDFLINVFHPQLEETLTEYCSQSFLQLDAFQQDPQWIQYSQTPTFKGAAKFMEVVRAFCKMLASLTHDQLFSQLVITQMNAYYDKCCAWYKALVARAQNKSDGRSVKAAAYFAMEGEIADTVDRILERGSSIDDALLDLETSQLATAIKTHDLDDLDLLIDRKVQASLCLMYTSMKWLATSIGQLRYISPKATDQTGMESDEARPRLKRSLTTALIRDRNHEGTAPVYLPLSEGMSTLFDGIIDGFEQLADSVLRTIHLSLRTHIAQSLGASFHGSLLYSDPADAPDEDVSTLLKELLCLHQELRVHLQADDYAFIVRGVGRFADTALVRAAVANITSMNANGCEHMFLNVQVLHHSLLHLEPRCTLPRSNAFFRLFESGPDAVVAAAHHAANGGDPALRFEKRESEALLKLWYSEKTESERNEEVVRGKKSLEEKLGQLGEALGAEG